MLQLSVETIRQSVRAITFDMYGTLLDLEASFAPGFEGFLRAKGFQGSAADVVVSWEAAYLHENMVDTFLSGNRTSFELVRRITLSQLFSRLRVEHTPDDIEGLVTTKATPTLFPDVEDALGKLRERFELAILSNGDLPSLERAATGLSIPVHRSISAEQADKYKPHEAVYQHAAKELGLDPGDILHVAAHAWDIRGARNVGMMGAYIDRYGVPYPDYGSGKAEIVVADLSQFAAQILD